MNRGYLNFHLQATLSDNLIIAAEPEVRIWFNNYPLNTDYIGGDHTGLPFRQFSSIAIAEASGTYSFFGNDNPLLKFSSGIFPVKYNPDAHNLGEYLFRTGAYVPYVQTFFEYQFGRLSGFRLSSVLGGIVQQDLFLHTEMQVQPLHDWSLSYLVNADMHVVEAGAGVSLHRYFPVSYALSQPKNPTNFYYDAQGDTAYFSFKGIKHMGRLAFDPKYLLPRAMAEKFGKQDLRLYTEAAVLGLKDYPAYMPQVTGTDTAWVLDSVKNFYDEISQRIPIMAGFTFPTCGLLDYFSLEIESYRWPQMDVYYEQSFQSENPRPPSITAVNKYTKDDYKYGEWKWSLNARKTVFNSFSLIAQVARDHMRYDIYYEKNRDEEEAFTRSQEWYWMVRMNYAF